MRRGGGQERWERVCPLQPRRRTPEAEGFGGGVGDAGEEGAARWAVPGCEAAWPPPSAGPDALWAAMGPPGGSLPQREAAASGRARGESSSRALTTAG